jgi:hypothetical protein
VPVWVAATGSDTADVLQQAQPDRLLQGLGELADWLQRQQ